MYSDAHRRLREGTRPDHERLEARLDIGRHLYDPAGRRHLLEGFFRLHAQLEAACAPWLDALEGLHFGERLRTPVLRADFADLGLTAPAQPAPALQAQNVGEAMGLLYVAEGSTLGGQMIRRQVAARGADFQGLSFLDPYGARTGERWRGFLAVLGREAATPARIDAAERGARAGFRHAEAVLCGAPAGV